MGDYKVTSQILLVAKKELHERKVRQHSPYHNEIQQLESQIAPLQRKLDKLNPSRINMSVGW